MPYGDVSESDFHVCRKCMSTVKETPSESLNSGKLPEDSDDTIERLLGQSKGRKAKVAQALPDAIAGLTDSDSVDSADAGSPLNLDRSLTVGTTDPLVGQSETTHKDPPKSTRKKRSPDKAPDPTSRAVKSQKRLRIGLRKRVKVSRGSLFHLLEYKEQKDAIRQFGNSYNCYGTIKGGGSQVGWTIDFDVFPSGSPPGKPGENFKRVKHLRRGLITIVSKDEEEKEYDQPPPLDLDVYEEIEEDSEEEDGVDAGCAKPKKKRRNAAADSAKSFMALTNEQAREAKEFDIQLDDSDPNSFVIWKIMEDGQHIDEGFPIDLNSLNTMKKDIHLATDGSNYHQVFFDHFFPSVAGHGKIIDEYVADPRCSINATVKRENICFHDDEAIDPDWKVKVCYLLLIAAANEVENGTNSLWSAGESKGLHNFPDFGRYMSKNMFSAFRIAAPYAFCSKETWFLPKRDREWSTFMPCLEDYNLRRRRLLNTALLMLDESMSGWRPKTSKLGGLPNYTYEPRKPVPLGTMFRNGVECTSGLLVFQDVVQAPEQQRRKKFHGEKSSLPTGGTISASTAETLRQVEGAAVQPGGWVGGDAWFGSVATTVEVMKRFGVHSTWIIKNNQTLFPMEALKKVMTARHGAKPAGHWVTMTTKIAGVNMFAVAFAWSQKGMAYFLSTCGSTRPAPELYVTNFEDDFGNITFKEIQRPWISYFLYNYLPLIDEHNKMRQDVLGLENSWPTKDCWFRLVTTMVGMSVVDFHRYYLWKTNTRVGEQAAENQLQLKRFTNVLCAHLKTIERNKTRRIPTVKGLQQRGETDLWIPIVDEGHAYKRLSESDRVRGRLSGKRKEKNCFICRKYLKENGTTQYRTTTWQCKDCGMPLCKIDRQMDVGRQSICSCMQEHKMSKDPWLGCFEGERFHNKGFPKELQKPYALPRRSERRQV